MALGKKGTQKIEQSAKGLFSKTEGLVSSEEASSPKLPPTSGPLVRKSFMLDHDTNEQLRRYAFEQRRKEADILREALEEFFNAHRG